MFVLLFMGEADSVCSLDWHDGPDDGNYENADEEHDDVERQTYLDIIGEAVAADALHEQVCLIADWR